MMHFQTKYSLSGFFSWHGETATTLFFIISGYLMAKKAVNKEKSITIAVDTWDFLLGKIKKWLIPFIICWIFSFILNSCINQRSFKEMGMEFLKSVPELLLLRSTGIMSSSYLSQTWYLSAMIIVMLGIYPLIRLIGNLYCAWIAPVSAILIYGYMSMDSEMLGYVMNPCGIFTKGLLVAAAGINLGIFLYFATFYANIMERYIQVLRGIRLLLWTLIFGYNCFPCSENIESTIVIFMFLGLFLEITCIKRKKHSEWLDKLSICLGDLSLYIYLIHFPIRDNIIPLLKGENYQLAYVFLILSLLGSFILKSVSVMTNKLLRSVISV